MNTELLRSLLNYEFYQRNRDKLVEDIFTGHGKTIFLVIQKAHEKYKSDLKVEWLRKLYDVMYPASTEANTRAIAILLSDMASVDPVPDEMAADIIAKAYRKHSAAKMAERAVEIINGDTDDFNGIREVYSRYVDNVQEIPVNYTEVEYDLERLLEQSDVSGLYPFRFKGLQNKVPGIGPGQFGVIFARPNVGKSAWSVFDTAGHIMSGRRVSYFGNEEPAHRLYTRLLCSVMEQPLSWIKAHRDETNAEFVKYKDNLRMLDCVGTDIHAVDNYVQKFKPDVVYLDQIDKFGIKGTFQRTDEKLGEIYQYAREIAKRNNCAVWGVCQANADAEGLQTLDYSMMSGSRTAKAGEADLIIGIGKSPFVPGANDDVRAINIIKNKVNGVHEIINCQLNSEKVIWEA